MDVRWSLVLPLLLLVVGLGVSHAWTPREPENMFCYSTAGGNLAFLHGSNKFTVPPLHQGLREEAVK